MNVVQNKLRNIAEYTVSADRIRRRPFYLAFILYSWGSELISALAGVGIGYPLLAQVAGGETPRTPVAFLSREQMLAGGVVCAVLWLLLKVGVTRQDGLKRGVLMRSCVREMSGERIKVERALRGEGEPLPKLNEAVQQLASIQDRYYQEGSWPFARGFAPGIDAAVAGEVDQWYKRWSDAFPESAQKLAGPNLRIQ